MLLYAAPLTKQDADGQKAVFRENFNKKKDKDVVNHVQNGPLSVVCLTPARPPSLLVTLWRRWFHRPWRVWVSGQAGSTWAPTVRTHDSGH